MASSLSAALGGFLTFVLGYGLPILGMSLLGKD